MEAKSSAINVDQADNNSMRVTHYTSGIEEELVHSDSTVGRQTYMKIKVNTQELTWFSRLQKINPFNLPKGSLK